MGAARPVDSQHARQAVGRTAGGHLVGRVHLAVVLALSKREVVDGRQVPDHISQAHLHPMLTRSASMLVGTTTGPRGVAGKAASPIRRVKGSGTAYD